MNPGREMDALVAEKIFGCVVKFSDDFFNGAAIAKNKNDFGKFTKIETISGPASLPKFWSLPHYSEDIAAAWAVVEKLLPRIISLRWCDDWEINEYLPDKKETVFLAEADTAPHAICLAALKAVGAI